MAERYRKRIPPGSSDRGTALVIILSITLLLATQIYIVWVLSSGNFRHVEKVNAHIRAISIGESVFSRISARLKGAPWAQRWFATAPATKDNVKFYGGIYSSYVATVPDPSTQQADVWIQATYETAVAVLFWRVRFADDTLDFSAQVYPQFFTFLPSDSSPPGPTLNRTTALISDMMQQQIQNRTKALQALKQIGTITNFDGLAAAFRIPVVGAVPDATAPPGGGGTAQSTYLASVDSSVNAGVPSPSPAPSPAGGSNDPSSLVSQYPTPRDLTDIVRAAMTQAGLNVPPLTKSMSALRTYFTANSSYFRNSMTSIQNSIDDQGEDEGNGGTSALTYYRDQLNKGTPGQIDGGQWSQEMDGAKALLNEVGNQYQATGNPQLLNLETILTKYFAQVTQNHGLAVGAAPPPGINMAPPSGAAMENNLAAFQAWWVAHP